jgi:two-component system, OmpR family, response regulator
MLFPSVIIVEDEVDLRDSMCAFLEASGFDVRGAGDGPGLDRLWAGRPANVLVLDVNLPGEDGYAIATRMRTAFGVGIIMLTARQRADDRITGFECGADNYLIKPVVLRELAAAVKGLSRRLGPPPPQENALPFVWSFDQVNWSLAAPNGVAVALTTAEFCLLNALATTPGVPVAGDDLLRALGKTVIETNRSSLDSVLSRLRRKVEGQTGLPLPVKAVRSLGYVFASPLKKG